MPDGDDQSWDDLFDDDGEIDVDLAIGRLRERWDDELAMELLWEALCHQGTCIWETYALFPTLIEMATGPENPEQRRELSAFLGYVVQVTFDRPSLPMGELPEPVVTPRRERAADEIAQVRQAFFRSLPEIRSICEQAFLENLVYADEAQCWLLGVAAADGLISLARGLENGETGWVECVHCDAHYGYSEIRELWGLYHRVVSSRGAIVITSLEQEHRDWRDGAPNNANSVVQPDPEPADHDDSRIRALVALARKSPTPRLLKRLKNLLGTFACSECGKTSPVVAIEPPIKAV